MTHRIEDPGAVLVAIADLSKELIRNCVSLESLSNVTLHYARKITGAEHGFASVIDPETKNNVGYTLTNMMGKFCEVTPQDQRICFPPSEDGTYPGLWGHALNTGQAFLTNDPGTHPMSIGIPHGHVPLDNFMAVPAVVGKRSLGMIALANKRGGFKDSDLRVGTLLAEIYAVALQRRQTEAELRNIHDRQRKTLEGRYRAFLQSSPDMLHLICRQGVFLDTHPGNVPSVMDPSHYIGKNLRDVFPAPFADAALERIQQSLEGDIPVDWEYTLPQLPGCTFEARISPSGSDEVLVLIRDISRAKDTQNRLERMVQERTQQLEASNEALQSFAYAASHDLREPLNKIQAFGKRLASLLGPDMPPKAQESLDVMLGASHRMVQLIDDLLSYSRAGSEESAPKVQISLTAVIAEVLADLTIPIEESEATVVVGDMPVVMGHRAQFHVLFQNLISNALKFKQKDESPIIRIDGVETDNSIIVSVADNGIGFEPRFAEQIFNVFKRLHTRFDYPGTGIGLALCRRIVSHYGGTITAEGRPGYGATFTITLPKGDRGTK